MAGKDRAARWAQGKPMRAILVIAGLGLVIGVLVGVAAGFTIEKHRVNRDVSKLKAQVSRSTSSPSTHAKAKVASGSGTLPVERVGTVTATGTGTITMATRQHGPLSLRLTARTHVDRAESGSTADITVRRRLIVARGAHDVIVLPTASTLGREVTKVANGVALVTKITGIAQLQLSNVQAVDTTSEAAASDVKVGSHVIAWYQAANGSVNAIEIIVLPAGSAFA